MVLKLCDISAGYNSIYLKNISFEFKCGDILCVMGSNGSGKSTLFKAILGISNKYFGNISIDGEDISKWDYKKLSKYFSYIPQINSYSFSYTVIDFVLMGRARYIKFMDLPSKNDRLIAYKSLCKVGISYLADKLYINLSGGERKLVLIARALCQNAKYIIMDEPTSDLDFIKSQVIYNVIKDLSSDGYGVILSTHSLEYPFDYDNKVLILKNGNMVSYGKSCDILTSENLKIAYDTDIDVIDIVDSRGNKRKICIAVKTNNKQVTNK